MNDDKYIEFVEMVARGVDWNGRALGAKARRLLGWPAYDIDIRGIKVTLLTEGYDSAYVVEAANYLECQLIEHGGIVLEMLWDEIPKVSGHRDGLIQYAELAKAIQYIDYIDDATKKAQREFTEKLLLHSGIFNADAIYGLLSALKRYCDPLSIAVINQLIAKDILSKENREYAVSVVKHIEAATLSDIPF